MDLGCATRAGAFRETKIITGSAKDDISRIDKYLEGCTVNSASFSYVYRVMEKSHVFVGLLTNSFSNKIVLHKLRSREIRISK